MAFAPPQPPQAMGVPMGSVGMTSAGDRQAIASINDPDLRNFVRSIDKDGDGNIDINEVISASRTFLAKKNEVKHLKRAIVAVVICVLMAGMMMYMLMIGANEASKETHVSHGQLQGVGTDGTEGPVEVQNALEYGTSILYLPKHGISVLNKVSTIMINIAWVNASTDGSNTYTMRDVASSSTRAVVGIDKYSDSVADIHLGTLNPRFGTRIEINGTHAMLWGSLPGGNDILIGFVDTGAKVVRRRRRRLSLEEGAGDADAHADPATMDELKEDERFEVELDGNGEPLLLSEAQAESVHICGHADVDACAVERERQQTEGDAQAEKTDGDADEDEGEDEAARNQHPARRFLSRVWRKLYGGYGGSSYGSSYGGGSYSGGSSYGGSTYSSSYSSGYSSSRRRYSDARRRSYVARRRYSGTYTVASSRRRTYYDSGRRRSYYSSGYGSSGASAYYSTGYGYTSADYSGYADTYSAVTVSGGSSGGSSAGIVGILFFLFCCGGGGFVFIRVRRGARFNF